MSRRWVVNASPLILLGKVEQLQLLIDLTDELIIPAGVAQEVRARPDGERALEALVASATVRIKSSDPIPRDIEVWDLGRGEVRGRRSMPMLDIPKPRHPPLSGFTPDPLSLAGF